MLMAAKGRKEMGDYRGQRTEGFERSGLDGVCPQITQSYAEGKRNGSRQDAENAMGAGRGTKGGTD